jgi:hypothetical protein
MGTHKWLIGCAAAFTLALAPDVFAADVTLTWDPSPDPGVAGYAVSYGTQSGVYTTRIDAGKVTSEPIMGLNDAATYYFVVQAYDSAGVAGPPSVEVSWKNSLVAAPSILCPAPSGTSSDGKPIAITFAPTVSGGTAPLNTVCSPESGSLFPVGSTPLACTVTDIMQRASTCQSTVTVLDGSSQRKPPPGQNNPPSSQTTDTTVSGSIAKLTGKCTSVTFEVGGRLVTTNSSTQYDKGSCGSLNNGKAVTVKGLTRPDNSVDAVVVQLK